jgi:hypothetical protein
MSMSKFWQERFSIHTGNCIDSDEQAGLLNQTLETHLLYFTSEQQRV